MMRTLPDLHLQEILLKCNWAINITMDATIEHKNILNLVKLGSTLKADLIRLRHWTIDTILAPICEIAQCFR